MPALGGLVWLLVALAGAASGEDAPLDRRAVVDRHSPLLESLDAEAPLSLGNGSFAFTVDATGLQTFPERYAETIPLGTLLAAVALMAAGWDGGPDTAAPGFPDDGSWVVRQENLARVP